jgi:hypothetical protein
MLALSPYLLFYQVITYPFRRSTYSSKYIHIPTLPIYYLPESLGSFYNCISIRMWFYNQFFTLLLRPLPLFRPSIGTRRSNHTSYWSLFILLYICLNLFIASEIHHGTVPLSFLGFLPTIVTFGHLPFHLPSFYATPSPHIHHNNKNLQPLPSRLHSNPNKLAYLCAWHSLQQHHTPRLMNFSPGGSAICVDFSASCCISNNKEDFLNLTPSSSPVLSGIAIGLEIAGKGTIQWTILNDAGDEVILHIHDSLYVPSIPINLLSPQQLVQQTGSTKDGFLVQASSGILRLASHKRTIYYNPTNNLPIFITASSIPSKLPAPSFAKSNSTTIAMLSSENLDTNTPLTSTQHRLLLKHQQLGHLHMSRVQDLAHSGLFGPSFTSIGHCDPPLCKACLHGKQHKRAVTPNTATGSIDALHLNPGDCVSGDQIESSTPGLVPTFQGSPTTAVYQAGTLFVDHASRYLHFTPHHSTGANEAVQAKLHFELHANTYNRLVKSYHANNGVFCSNLFRDSRLSRGQHLQFCGVNAHHQNGIAEQYIRTITERARTMLIHSMICWPDIIQENLWPYAIRSAVAIHNATPGPSGLSPEEIFTGIKHPTHLSVFHPFGCPIFVLDPSLQQGKKIPRWKPRSRVGVYLGPPPEHASSVPLVLSTTIDEDFSKTNLYDRSWFHHQSQRELISPPIPTDAPTVVPTNAPLDTPPLYLLQLQIRRLERL